MEYILFVFMYLYGFIKPFYSYLITYLSLFELAHSIALFMLC